MIVKCFTSPLDFETISLYNKDDNEVIICADRACLICAQNKIEIDYAIGDFDSVSTSELETIKNAARYVESFSAEKDYTDTYLVIKKALSQDFDEIILYGGLGNRIDHTLANLDLLMLGPIKQFTKDTLVYVLDPGLYEIENPYDYISFYPIESVEGLSLTGFSYPLKDYQLNRFDPLCISNQGEGSISFSKGCILVIHSNEKSTL